MDLCMGREAHEKFRLSKICSRFAFCEFFVSFLCTCYFRVSQECMNSLELLCMLQLQSGIYWVRLEELLSFPGKCHFHIQCIVRGICSQSSEPPFIRWHSFWSSQPTPHHIPAGAAHQLSYGEMGAAFRNSTTDSSCSYLKFSSFQA